jgi:hypothetical protein
MKTVPSRSQPMNAVLQCLRQSFGLTKWEAVPHGKNWQQHRAADSGGVSQSLDPDVTIFMLATLVTPATD